MMLWEISLLILAIGLLIVAAFLVPTIVQMRRTALKMEDVAADLDRRLPQILEHVEQISQDLAVITKSGREQVGTVGEAVEQVKEMVDDLTGLRMKLRRRDDAPVLRGLRTITAVTRAAHAFLSVLVSRRASRER